MRKVVKAGFSPDHGRSMWKAAALTSSAAVALFFLVLSAPSNVEGAEPLMLSGNPVHVLNGYMESLVDTDRALTIDEIRSSASSAHFIPVDKSFTFFDFSRGAYWLRFSLKRPSSPPPGVQMLKDPEPWWIEIPEPPLARAELYIPLPQRDEGSREGLRYVVRKAGLDLDEAERDRLSATPLLTIPADFEDGATFYLRLEGLGLFQQPIYLWSHNAFQLRAWVGDLWFAIPCGMLIAVFFYNFFIFLSLRERVYGWYLFYVAALLFSQLYLDNRFFILLGLNAGQGMILEALLFAVLNISVVEFTRVFLAPKINIPSVEKMFDLILWMGLPVVVLVAARQYKYADMVVSFTMLATSTTFLYTAIRCYRKGFRPALFYLVASSSFLAGIVAQVIWWRGGVFHPNLVCIPPVLVGSSLEALLFSFALSDRIRTMNKEKESARVALRKSESFFRDVVGSISEGVLVTDEAGSLTYVAPRAARMLEAMNGDASGPRTLHTLLGLEPAVNGASRGSEEVESREVTVSCRDDKDRTFLVDSRPLSLDPCRRLFTFRDITERRQLEQEVMEIGEHERSRIGQDLHDGHCQQLAGILFLCEALHMRLVQRADGELGAVQRIADLINEAIGQAKSISKGLCPLNDDPKALAMALHQLAFTISSTFDLSCRCSCGKDVEIPERDTALHLYRIAQEAVNNAIRHGHAANITLELLFTPEALVMNVDDDGAGFDATSVKPGGMGMKIMEYRARSFGGQLRIQRKLSGGTLVSCRLNKTPVESKGGR
jgi:signal transduction histidine kinase